MAPPVISEPDRAVLRDLARRVAELGADPEQERKADAWRDHNDLVPGKPLVLVFPEGSWRELLPESALECEGGPARGIERGLRVRIYHGETLLDDNVIEPVAVSPLVVRNSGWGLAGEITRPEESTGAYHLDGVLDTMDDVEKIALPELVFDEDATAETLAFTEELFGDILTVEQRGMGNFGMAPVDQYARLRGIDRMFLDLIDDPKLFHAAVDRLVQGHIGMAKQAETLGVISVTNRNQYCGSGGTSYTRQLPRDDFDGEHVRCMDVWGFATPQIFSDVSPDMHWEFALEHEIPFLELFGLNCYGCCEPLDRKLDYVKRIPRLRRVSISPWADVARSAEELGSDYVFSWKPNPAIVAGEAWDPDAARRIVRETLEKTEGCIVEMALKDTHTCRNEPHRMAEWVRIAKEEADAFASTRA